MVECAGISGASWRAATRAARPRQPGPPRSMMRLRARRLRRTAGCRDVGGRRHRGRGARQAGRRMGSRAGEPAGGILMRWRSGLATMRFGWRCGCGTWQCPGPAVRMGTLGWMAGDRACRRPAGRRLGLAVLPRAVRGRPCRVEPFKKGRLEGLPSRTALDGWRIRRYGLRSRYPRS